MSKAQKLSANSRSVSGRKVKTLRKQGLIPANVFGKKIESKSIQVDEKTLLAVYEEVGETGLIDLEIDSQKAVPVLISDYQVDPISGNIIHVDFHQVDLTVKVNASVPIEIVGEAPAVKEKGGILNITLNEIEVEALPADLPENIIVDTSVLLEIGDAITVGDLKIDSTKITIDIDPTTTIVAVQEQKEEEPEAETETPAEAETTVQAAKPESSETDTKPEDQAKNQ